MLINGVDTLEKEELFVDCKINIIACDKTVKTFPQRRMIDSLDGAKGKEKTKLSELFKEVGLLSSI